jgi:hypothetical protein
MEFFKGKTPAKMSKYIKVLSNLDASIDKSFRLLKKVFHDKDTYYRFLRDNL